ncbi:hypothetical protein D7Y54_00355 [Stenotrophomonas maltophilia]|nr:hypothetical protein [Stenotrophomonas maltophilia]
MHSSIQLLALRATSEDDLAEQITMDHGLFVPVADAWQALGYPSQGAARRAAASDRLGMECIQIPGRRARVVRSVDLAHWLFRHFGRSA